ncbi:hypothetical protein [Croceicoccus hydrothermalis]|nr:hypothetical protein [Croceicoccus hydrothermalis]
MTKTTTKAWPRPELRVLGTMADVAGNGTVQNQGRSSGSVANS